MKRLALPTLIALALAACQAGPGVSLHEPLGLLGSERGAVSGRLSSFDRSGANHDRISLPANASTKLGEIDGAGLVTHIWFTFNPGKVNYLDNVWLKFHWDGEESPSVYAPLGPFFLLGHGEIDDVESHYVSVLKAVHIAAPPGNGAFNCYFPMPFAKKAVLFLENRGDEEIPIAYYQVDYVKLPSPPKPLLHFRASYNREAKTNADDFRKANPGAEKNFVILDRRGEGAYIGCSMSVTSEPGQRGKWWEGDDMIFIDGEKWPPAIPGTGTEDYFSGAWGFRRKYCRPYYGCSFFQKGIFPEERYYDGRYTVYRFHPRDPLFFTKSIKVTIEHGHGNDAENEYEAVAYYYTRP